MRTLILALLILVPLAGCGPGVTVADNGRSDAPPATANNAPVPPAPDTRKADLVKACIEAGADLAEVNAAGLHMGPKSAAEVGNAVRRDAGLRAELEALDTAQLETRLVDLRVATARARQDQRR